MKKILLKLSGESLGKNGIDSKMLERVAREIAVVAKNEIALAIVIGGGNIWRWRDNSYLASLPRVESDFLGMLATVFNAVTLAAALRKLKINVKVFSAVAAPVELAEKYSPTAARKFLEKSGMIILAGGTGKPFVTTDSGAALRAAELKCDLVVKATNVDGVFDKDPRKSRTAKLLEEVDYKTAIRKKLGVMDLQAFRILAKSGIPTRVFNFKKKGLLKKAVEGKNVGSLVK
ncbi:MAG: UMP kinase [Patescibacteria group bacterium]